MSDSKFMQPATAGSGGCLSRQENHFDIILMDIRMPIKDGLYGGQ